MSFSSRALRICMVASEVAPFAKTGGLADVAAGLGRHLGKAGHDVRVFMPMYGRVRDGGFRFTPLADVQDVPVRMGDVTRIFSLSTAPLPQSDVQVHFVRCPELFGAGIYHDDELEPLRFGLLTRATLESCQRLQWGPDVFHCNDWHTGLLPLYLKTSYAWDALFAPSKTLLTIHNIAYAGSCSSDLLEPLGLADERHLLDRRDLGRGSFSFLRTGVQFADALSTVSATYAAELQTPDYGMGFENDLRARAADLHGIVNGVDYGDWDPAHDTLIARCYDASDPSGKEVDKRDLLEDFGLRFDPAVPVLGVVSRLTFQKGFELLAEVLPVLLQSRDLQLVALGSGEAKYERHFQWLRDTYPDKVAFFRGFDNRLAHRIEAGADLFLMPSRFEPCGLNQMYSLRYGTPPVVRKTGGLADTVVDFDPATGEGTGFVFEPVDSHALLATIERGLEVFADRDLWRRLLRNAMAQDWSWDVQGPHYEALYRSL